MDLSVGIKNELSRLSDICKLRLESYFRRPGNDHVLRFVKDSEWSSGFKSAFDLSDDEYIAFLMALAPHVFPSFFENLIQEFLPEGGEFTEFGGVKGSNHRGVLPTGETVQFILAGDDLEKRLKVQEIFRESGNLFRQNILWLESVREGEPMMSGRLIVAEEWIEKVLFGRDYSPRFGLDFPARKITTKMAWDDVVLHPRTRQQIKHISVWLEHHKTMMADSNLQRRVKPGFRVLFYGPPGTGKTLSTALLGKQFN
jgi:hypothetical protein